MLPIDPQIAVYGQWLLFLGASALGIWGTGYLIWVSAQLGNHWYCWLDRKRDFQNQKSRTDLNHHQAVKDLELKALRAQQEMELARAKAHSDALNVALVQVEGGDPVPPIPIKSLG